MKQLKGIPDPLAYGIIGVALAVLFVSAHKTYFEAPAEFRPDPTPILVELFTSEGCNNCPPADAVLTKLSQRQDMAHIEVVPIAWHVDYWDQLGWVDRFASGDATARQTGYAQRANSSRLYTPQMVIDGAAVLVGNDEDEVREAVYQSATLPKAMMNVRMTNSGDDSIYQFAVSITRLPLRISEGRVIVQFILTEDRLASTVTDGENAGAQLKHAAVVRAYRKIGHLDCDVARQFSGKAQVQRHADWKEENLNVVVIAQELDTMHVLGIFQQPLLAMRDSKI